MTTALNIEERAAFALASDAPRQPRVRGHLFILPSFLIVFFVMGWFITYGGWRFFDRENYGRFYDAQARSLMQGKLDVPPEAIGPEAFIRDGKYYGYFGIAPALFRVPLHLAWPGMDDHWSRCLVMLAAAIGLIYSYQILVLTAWQDREPIGIGRGLLFSLFVLSAGLGSTNIYIVGRSFLYHEAIIWGSSLSIVFCYYLLRFLRERATSLLALACLACFFAFLSRVTAGAGCLLATMILLAGQSLQMFHHWRGPLSHEAPRERRARRVFLQTCIPAFTVAAAIACHLAITYGKFHTFNGIPFKYYLPYQLDPERWQLSGGAQIHPRNLRTGFANYLGFGGLQVGPSFPWFAMSRAARVFPETRFDNIEPCCGIPMSAPALFLLACIGLAGIASGRLPELRRMRLPVIAMAAGGSVILVSTGLCERYAHDLFPLLILAAVAGVARLAAVRTDMRRRTLMALVPLTLMGIAVNMAFALEYQRDYIDGVPESKRQEFRSWRDAIDIRLYGKPLHGDQLGSWIVD